MTEIEERTGWIKRKTKIVDILEPKISPERLESWSDVMREGWINPGYYIEGVIPSYIRKIYDLINFINSEALDLLNEHPDQMAILIKNKEFLSVKDSKDPKITSIICGLRYLQEKNDLQGVINFVRYRKYQSKINKLIKKYGETWLDKVR